MSFKPRLSVATTLKLSPPLMSCVSAPANWMVGDTTSRCTPPGLRDVSHPQKAPTSAHIPHSSPRPRRIMAPRLLPGVGRHQVVDYVRRDQNQQIAPLFFLMAEAEQLADDRQVYKKGDSRLDHSDRSHREAADHGGLAVVDEDLVIRLLRLEREADVHRGRFHGGVLGVYLHEHLAVGS